MGFYTLSDRAIDILAFALGRKSQGKEWFSGISEAHSSRLLKLRYLYKDSETGLYRITKTGEKRLQKIRRP